MTKRLQNQVSESRLTLPFVMVYALCVWLACGLIQQQWWIQVLCFAASTYLMIELNNHHALIRIYSRMVSCSFLVLSCVACFLFPSMNSAITQLAVIASLILLFNTYQDKQSVGWTFYAFLLVSLGSLAFVHILCFVPIIWLLMATSLQSLSWRTFFASLIGLLTPYWFAACWLVYQGDLALLVGHFTQLGELGLPFDFHSWSTGQMVTMAWLLVVNLTGVIHYIRTSYNDKIRIRMLYGCFIWLNVVAVTFLLLQPQHYDVLVRIIIVNTAPLIAHFIALTHTRLTNWAFYGVVVVSLILTAYNLWTSSFLF